MTELTTQTLNEAKEKMDNAISYLEETLLSIRAGRASVAMLNGIMVDYYGNTTPLDQVSSLTIPDARTIIVQPWEKGLLTIVEKAIIDSNIGITPINNGDSLRLSIPPLTEERRKNLTKQVKVEAEIAKVSMRNARRDAVDTFKKAQKDGMPEDAARDGETKAQKLIDDYSAKVDKMVEGKQTDIMTV